MRTSSSVRINAPPIYAERMSARIVIGDKVEEIGYLPGQAH